MGLMVGILVGALTLGSALAASVQRVRRRRLAHAGRRRRRRRALVAALLIGFAGIGPNRAPSPPFDPRAVLDGVARRAAATRQPRLSRPHVGALRDVGVDRRVPARELRAHDAAGRGADGGQAGRLRDDRGRRHRLGRGGPARRPARPHDDHDRRDGGLAAPARRRSASCSAAIRGCSSPCASSGASASSRTRRSSRRRSPSWPIAPRVGTMLTRADGARLHADAGHDPV